MTVQLKSFCRRWLPSASQEQASTLWQVFPMSCWQGDACLCSHIIPYASMVETLLHDLVDTTLQTFLCHTFDSACCSRCGRHTWVLLIHQNNQSLVCKLGRPKLSGLGASQLCAASLLWADHPKHWLFMQTCCFKLLQNQLLCLIPTSVW